MTYPKVCLNCNSPFEAKRASVRFCGDDCRNEWHTENRAASSEKAPQRVEHALDDVRGLHEEHAGDWTAIIREHARRTLLTTGYLSAADFEALGVPEEHCNLPGAQIGALAAGGYMEAVTFRRWSAEAKASRKSGKYWIYRITHKGKEKLSPPVGSSGDMPHGASLVAAASNRDKEPILGLDAHQEKRKGGRQEVESVHGAAPSTGRGPLPHGAGAPMSIEPEDGSGEALRLDIPRESESSAYSTWMENAA